MRLWGRQLLLSTSLTTVKFVHLHSSGCTFFERVGHKMFWSLLSYIVAKAWASPRLFLFVRGWSLGTRLVVSRPLRLWRFGNETKRSVNEAKYIQLMPNSDSKLTVFYIICSELLSVVSTCMKDVYDFYIPFFFQRNAYKVMYGVV